MHETRITFTLNHLVAELNATADKILRQRFALTYSQFVFLVTLQGAGTIASSGLAKLLGVSRTAVSKRTGWFVSRDLVEVAATSQDSRSVQLTLSAQGHERVDAAAAVLEAEFRQMFQGIDGIHGVNLDELHQTLTVIRQVLKRYPVGSSAPTQLNKR